MNEDCAYGAGKRAQKLKVFVAQALGPEFDLQSSHIKSGVVETGGSWGSAIESFGEVQGSENPCLKTG